MYLVFGYFGYRTNQLDGQTVKTRDLYRLFGENVSSVDYFDTQDFQYNKWSLFVLLKKLISCKTLVYLPAHNNLKYIFPVVYVLSKIFRFKILYFVIGGWLVEYIRNKPLHRWMLKDVDGIFTETKLMSESLQLEYKYSNVKVLSNFRFINFIPQNYHETGKLKLVFLGRINKMKGLDVIFYLAKYLVDSGLQCKISIDFYGPIYQPDKIYFFTELAKYNFVHYKGELQPEVINNTIEKYDVMLLPTHYFTEGLPGSVLDAYISGIPIIVSNWKHAKEFIKDGKTGYIIPFEHGEQMLIDRVEKLLCDPSLLFELKKNAYKESIKYSSVEAWNIIRDYIN